MTELLKLFFTPLVLIIFLLTAGLVLTIRIKQKTAGKWGWRALFAGTVMIFLLSVSPVANVLVYQLEHEYSPVSSESLSDLDIMVILGGGVNPQGASADFYEPSGITYSRVYNGVDIFKRSGAKILVLSGAAPRFAKQSEAEVMARLAIRLGAPENELMLEPKSHNTMEEADELGKIFPPAMKKRIGIVTSAMHMSRSCYAFWRIYGKQYIVPIPVNYLYSAQRQSLKSLMPSADAFQTSCSAIHEWVGRLWYFFTARGSNIT